jgi:hypothetical protein
MNRFSPPKRVLLEFCHGAPGLQVRDCTIKADPEINPGEVLTQTEKNIAQILAEHGGTVAPWELKRMCLDMGMNLPGLVRCLLYSPIILKDASGLYRLIGSGKKTWYGASHQKKILKKIQPRDSSTIDATIFPSGQLPVRQVSQILGISPRAVHYHAKSGRLKGIKTLQKTWRFQIQDIHEFKAQIDALRVKGLSRIRIT